MKNLKINTILLLSALLLTFGCKKDDEISNPGIDNGKLPFTAALPKDVYYTNINPSAEPYAGGAINNSNDYTFTSGFFSNRYKVTNFQFFTWILKPLSNPSWVTKPSSVILLDMDLGTGDLAEGQSLPKLNRESYMLDQVLIPESSIGASNIYPLLSSRDAINNPLTVSVEYWRSKFGSTLIPASSVSKGESYVKQTDPGTKLETKTITFKAEFFDLPKSIDVINKSSGTIDLFSWLDSSVATSIDGKQVVSFIGDYNAIIDGHILDLSKVTKGTLTLTAVKHYDNGSYQIQKTISVN